MQRVGRDAATDHSVKPAFFHEMVERLYPELPKD